MSCIDLFNLGGADVAVLLTQSNENKKEKYIEWLKCANNVLTPEQVKMFLFWIGAITGEIGEIREGD